MANRRVHRRSQSRAAPLESLQGDQFLDFRYNRVDRFPVPWSIGGRSDGSLLFRVASAPRQRIRRAHGSNASDQIREHLGGSPLARLWASSNDAQTRGLKTQRGRWQSAQSF